MNKVGYQCRICDEFILATNDTIDREYNLHTTDCMITKLRSLEAKLDLIKTNNERNVT